MFKRSLTALRGCWLGLALFPLAQFFALTSLQAELKESFEFPTEPTEDLTKQAGSARHVGVRLPPWNAGLRMQREYGEGDALPWFIAEGSLEYKTYPSSGNRVANPQNSNYHLTLSQNLDFRDSELAGGLLDPSSKKEENPERSVRGWGAPSQTLWFSALIQSGVGDVTLQLRNSAFPPSNNGLTVHYSPSKGSIQVGQHWQSLGHQKREENIASGEVFFTSTEPFWIVGKLETGPEWGTSAAYESFHPGSDMHTDRPEPTGKLTIWIDPTIGNEPDEKTAALQIPLHEFRITSFSLILNPGGEADEVRIASSFSSL